MAEKYKLLQMQEVELPDARNSFRLSARVKELVIESEENAGGAEA